MEAFEVKIFLEEVSLAQRFECSVKTQTGKVNDCMYLFIVMCNKKVFKHVQRLRIYRVQYIC